MIKERRSCRLKKIPEASVLYFIYYLLMEKMGDPFIDQEGDKAVNSGLDHIKADDKGHQIPYDIPADTH